MADPGLLGQRLGQQTVLSEEEHKAAACSIASLGSLPLHLWVHEFYLSPLAVAMSMLFPSVKTLGLLLGPRSCDGLSSFSSLWEDLELVEHGQSHSGSLEQPQWRAVLGQEVTQNVYRSYTSLTLRHRLKSMLSLLLTVNY